MYLFLIPDSLQTTNRDKQEEKTTSSFYLLKALAGVICLFLLIIVIKLFKKSKSRKGKRGNGTENKSQIQLQKDIDTSYSTVSESLRTFPHYQSCHGRRHFHFLYLHSRDVFRDLPKKPEKLRLLQKPIKYGEVG